MGIEKESELDPISLATLGGTALTEGIKFLYGQASEVLKRRREREKGSAEKTAKPLPTAGADDVLQGRLEPPSISFETLDRVADDLESLCTVLGRQIRQDASTSEQDVLETAEAVRKALEVVYGQRITFKGEDRMPSGPVVIGKAEAEQVTGDLAGVRARLIRSGHVEGTIEADEVSGRAAGVDVDTIG